MSPNFSLGKSEIWNRTVRGVKKVVRWIIALLVMATAVFVYVNYFHTFSEGYRAGTLQKFSRKGVIFKTYEGELILSGAGAENEIIISPEKFSFTMVNKDLVRQFDTLQGQNVIVHFIQKNGAVFWRGESKFLVDSVRSRR
ncbi:MAG TPA: hypothetical protein PLO24_00130 [Bacteroidales bacterium]|mgnify:FL=1|jgi:hypothetical protein|nr:hypothetical protein [Bacteroidales bacterium]HOS70812.1 hypothetical protein [Bacteroidales bacterium]HQH24429.1 hypothetical protein [Bacteroidales bacterium]HQJ81438.1 hypothetical protein [Bacteroidales bacterium]